MKKAAFVGIAIMLLLFLPLMFSCRSQETTQEEQEPLIHEEPLVSEEAQAQKEEPLISGVDGVTHPERIPESYVKPVFPEEARKEKIEGMVILQIVVKRDGTVGDIQVLRSPSEKKIDFEEAAIEAVKQWRYKPAMKDEQPVEVYLTVQVAFELK